MSSRIHAVVLVCVLFGAGVSADEVPGNLGRGLRPILEEYRAELGAGKSEGESFRGAIATSDHAQVDASNRVLVDVMGDGRAPLDQVRRRCESLGGKVTAEAGWYRHGMFSAWVPLAGAETLARTPGVSAVHLAPGRQLRVGAVTSQGAVVHKTDLVNNNGYLGAGVTVGVLSDSFDDDHADERDPGWTNANDDIATGDLPGPGNPGGYTTPVDVIQDDNSPSTDTDEGRALLQIIHDVAPAANLAFCTTGNTDAEMAANIGRLVSSGSCQVICDDTALFDEPTFSDGIIAQAIDSAAAAGVAYFSAVGNDGNSGYQATFDPVSETEGRAQASAEGVVWSSIPKAVREKIYQWHEFGTDGSGNPVVVQKIRTGIAPTVMIFQWDDPFDVVNNGTDGITTDYDILVFNSHGDYSGRLSGVEDSISNNEPLQFPAGNMNANSTYKICIVQTTLTNGTIPRKATHLRYLATDDVDVITGDYIEPSNVSAFGHVYAAGCSGVGAYNYDDAPDPGNTGHTYTPLIEGFSSNGPVDVYFDPAGNRLTTPIVRMDPMFCCTDNVDTTFFPPWPKVPNPNDYDFDGWPNFAGTSASVAHAAGIAALLINAAAVNSLGTLTPQQIQDFMIETTQGQIDEDPIFCSGTAGPVALTDSGDAVILPNVFEIALSGTATEKLTSVSINLTPVNMHFDTNIKGNGYPFVLASRTGKPAPSAGKATYFGGSSGKGIITIPLARFSPGDTLSFYIGFDDDDTGLYGYDADELGGASFTATVGGVIYSGTLGNQLGTSYNYKAGYGLLDAQAAVTLLLKGP
jgi:hypothetical protein